MKLPRNEIYNLCNQMRRSSTSVCLNIVEGNTRYYKKEQAKFADNALGSLMELHACLHICLKLLYLNKEDINRLNILMKELYFKLIAYKKSKFK